MTITKKFLNRISYCIVVTFLIYSGYYAIHSRQKLKNYGKYTVGVIKEIRSAGNGLRVFISFKFNNKDHLVDYIEDIGIISKLFIGRKLIIKFIPNDLDRTFNFNVDCKVPESLIAPEMGRDSIWVKVH